MSLLHNRLTEHLDEKGVAYHVFQHQVDYTAHQTASDLLMSDTEFAKAVILQADGELIMAVLPANEHVDLAKVKTELGAESVQLVVESRLSDIFPDCELGAEPPFGNLYDLPVLVSRSLIAEPHITFNAGTHTQAIRIAYEDYDRLVHPRVMDMAEMVA